MSKLKEFSELQGKSFNFIEGDISSIATLEKIFQEKTPEKVVNLAAQAGLRYSLINPHAYIQSNIIGFTNIIEACRHYDVTGLIYASSSSVYGDNKKIPFSISHSVDRPISIYAASKRSNELIANTYSHLYGIHTTGLRFFTVYGPWGRPDMAAFGFLRKILASEEIEIFKNVLSKIIKNLNS